MPEHDHRRMPDPAQGEQLSPLRRRAVAPGAFSYESGRRTATGLLRRDIILYAQRDGCLAALPWSWRS